MGLDVPSPSVSALRRANRVVEWLQKWIDVRVEGIENVPSTSEPLMFVGNHQLLALDTAFFAAAVWRRWEVPLRPLADDLLFALSPLGRRLRSVGVVRASREAAGALLEQGAWLLVYPGGAREAIKPGGRPYALLWWDRLGFAEVALQHRCRIVPVAAKGLDGALWFALGADRVLRSSLGAWLLRLGVRRDALPPVAVPRRVPRLHFRICEPLEANPFAAGDLATTARRLRGEVASALEGALADMPH